MAKKRRATRPSVLLLFRTARSTAKPARLVHTARERPGWRPQSTGPPWPLHSCNGTMQPLQQQQLETELVAGLHPGHHWCRRYGGLNSAMWTRAGLMFAVRRCRPGGLSALLTSAGVHPLWLKYKVLNITDAETYGTTASREVC